MNLKIKLIVLAASISLFSCAVSYTALKFSNPEDNSPTEDFILTKDGQVHKFSGIKESSLIKKNYFVISESEKYPSANVISYKVGGNEYRRIEGFTAKKIVNGRINVYLNSSSYTVVGETNAGGGPRSHSSNRYYVQKGKNEPIMLIPQYAKKEIYNMLSDFQPSKDIMDKYLKSANQISMSKVVDAINVYNIR